MKIGIVTAWFERGAAYVSRFYMDSLKKEGHDVYIYARGGENHPSKKTPLWNDTNVTRDEKFFDGSIDIKKISAWIKKLNLDCVFFNEQHNFKDVAKIKKAFPNVKIGAYIDYYTERTLPWFNMYDFVICNTKRHMQAMSKHPQKIYIKYGTDIDLYKPSHEKHDKVTFFHSVGMSPRKGTDILLDAYIKGECYKKSKLVVHTQIPIDSVSNYSKEDLEKYGIEVIQKTVPAPGLYYMGDVYVYPTRLDGLGLTMYEALASGLPVITTNFPPMNEAVNNNVGRLVDVEDFYCRWDAYYFPMAVCSEKSLIDCLNYYIDNPDILENQKVEARKFAEENYDMSKKSKEISDAFENAEIRPFDEKLYNSIFKMHSFKNSTFANKIRNRKSLKKIIGK